MVAYTPNTTQETLAHFLILSSVFKVTQLFNYLSMCLQVLSELVVLRLFGCVTTILCLTISKCNNLTTMKSRTVHSGA